MKKKITHARPQSEWEGGEVVECGYLEDQRNTYIIICKLTGHLYVYGT